jgi:UDP-glucose 4-epimerase
MKYLVTGGSGFLGQTVIRYLTNDENSEVVLLGRKDPKIDDVKYDFFEGDITDVESLKRCHDLHPSVTTIVHLAARVPKTANEDLACDMIEVNVKGTVNLLNVFGDKLGNFVYASTAEVYGSITQHGLINELSAIPLPQSNYGSSKLAGECFARVYGLRHNLPISIMRFTVLYGPGDTIQRAIPNFINKALAGDDLEVFGGEELRDYLHIQDAARAVYLAAKKPTTGTYNIGTGRGISIRDTAQEIVKLVGNPRVKIKILARKKQAADIVLSVERAKSDLGFLAEHTFPALLEEQIEWHKNN